MTSIPIQAPTNSSIDKVKEGLTTMKKQNAAGGDSILLQFHLGPKGLQWLAKLYTKTMESGFIPKPWQEVMIIAVLKSGKLIDNLEAVGQYHSFAQPINSWNVSSSGVSALLSSQGSLMNKGDSSLSEVAVTKFWAL